MGIFDKLFKKNEENNNQKDNKHDIERYVKERLNKADELSKIVNSTTDEKEFALCLNEIISILYELTSYENEVSFKTPPSKQLNIILENRSKTFNLLQERINRKNFDLESFAKECNDSLEKEYNSDSVIPTELRGTLDIYFEQAARFLIKKGKASYGMIQREYRIGFNRASRIIDQLEECGVIGKQIGTKPREILMSLEEFEIIVKDFRNTEKEYKNNIRNDISNKEEIQNRINMYNNKYDYMEGHDFEYFCADILRKNNYKNVEVTQGSGDQGIDIIAYKDGVKYGIQCKCYSSDIGNKAVQEAFSGSKFYDCHVPVVLTNRFFTKSAKELAQKNNVLLWDRDYLDRLIESAEDA